MKEFENLVYLNFKSRQAGLRKAQGCQSAQTPKSGYPNQKVWIWSNFFTEALRVSEILKIL